MPEELPAHPWLRRAQTNEQAERTCRGASVDRTLARQQRALRQVGEAAAASVSHDEHHVALASVRQVEQRARACAGVLSLGVSVSCALSEHCRATPGARPRSIRQHEASEAYGGCCDR